MFEFLLLRQNLPFTVSIGIMVLIALMEGLGAVLGFGLSDFLHSLIPDMDWHVDTPDMDAESGLTKFLGWIRIGKVPLMVILILFLMSFGLIGLVMQMITNHLTGSVLPGWVGSTVAFTGSVPLVRLLGRGVARVMPQDETDAISEASYIGRTASIVIGKAGFGCPAQAKLRDQHGTTHYIMVEPDEKGEIFEQGASVLIVSQDRSVFKVIKDTISTHSKPE